MVVTCKCFVSSQDERTRRNESSLTQKLPAELVTATAGEERGHLSLTSAPWPHLLHLLASPPDLHRLRVSVSWAP